MSEKEGFFDNVSRSMVPLINRCRGKRVFLVSEEYWAQCVTRFKSNGMTR